MYVKCYAYVMIMLYFVYLDIILFFCLDVINYGFFIIIKEYNVVYCI